MILLFLECQKREEREEVEFITIYSSNKIYLLFHNLFCSCMTYYRLGLDSCRTYARSGSVHVGPI